MRAKISALIWRALLLGAVLTGIIAWSMRDLVHNFDCPPGTFDWCAWTLGFVVKAFGPVFLIVSAVALSILITVEWLRRAPDR